MATAPSMAKDGSEAPSAKTSLNTGVQQRDSRHAWLGAAALIFALSTTFALTQKPRSNPLQPVQTLSTDWWLNPIERNAFKRLPAVAGRLEAVHINTLAL